MLIIYLTAALTGAAAVANLIGADYPKREADRNRVPRSWVRPLGVLLAAGAIGLLLPPVSVLAAAGLVLYFLGALGAHVRARNFRLGAWAVYFGASVAALAANLVQR
ncbi:DoxX family protein [Actinoplanes aureus]|uniref:DoxX family protein n=1 Tax=Actinoplanes aureus TaxID=2792083 RepID=A0A931CC99_9ACTN|nr:DoxX family protein [Actinoplanes aureus]MBG0564488.1 DoxX family protein [Actinoplanes aureus]